VVRQVISFYIRRCGRCLKSVGTLSTKSLPCAFLSPRVSLRPRGTLGWTNGTRIPKKWFEDVQAWPCISEDREFTLLGATRTHQARVFGPTPSPHPYVTPVTDLPSRAEDTDDLKDRTMFPLPQLEYCLAAFYGVLALFILMLARRPTCRICLHRGYCPNRPRRPSTRCVKIGGSLPASISQDPAGRGGDVIPL